MAVRLEAGVVSNKPVSVRQLIEQAEAEAAMDATARGMALIVPAVAPELQVSVDAHISSARLEEAVERLWAAERNDQVPRGLLARAEELRRELQRGELRPGLQQPRDLGERTRRRDRLGKSRSTFDAD